ncbi:MAG TPA: fused MFS/spermidine synthase [Myxococcota bacterium]|nr:fused MFS/spermidine synthase [Myxococcota bacterium]
MARGRRLAITACVLFSGLAALIYQVIWTRFLGFAFGTTTEAIGSVLAIFFGGMALGNLWAARRLSRLRRPLRVYGWLEGGVGLWAFGSLPLLERMDRLYAFLGEGVGPAAGLLLRLCAAAALLLPPTIAIGATLPVVARGLIGEDRTRGRWSAILYSSNTLGAVLGAYASGFWLVPQLGLTRAIFLAGAVSLCVGAFALFTGEDAEARSPTPRDDFTLDAEDLSLQEAPLAESDRSVVSGGRRIFLILFGISGFVAIGYEIVWSKVLGIILEGTLYGFAAVLSVYLLGITLGSMAVARSVDRVRDLPRAFALLHTGIAATVCIGILAVPYLPFALHQLTRAIGGGDPVQLLLLVAAPLVLLPTALFGASFPILIRILSREASDVGRAIGIATAMNTAGSIVSSLCVGFWAVPLLGLDATLYALVLIDVGIAVIALLSVQGGPAPARIGALASSIAVALIVALTFPGARVGAAIAGRNVKSDSLKAYWSDVSRIESSLRFLAEGRNSVVSVHQTPNGRMLDNNGLSEGELRYGPPYLALEEALLGILPYLGAESPKRALVVGLGGGNTLNALRATAIAKIDVAELEPKVLEGLEVLYEGRESPLSDPRISVLLNDGRNELLRGRYALTKRYDVIASQPSHPWLAGAANLFTEEFFALARANLTDTGVFALWVNGFRTDSASILAIATSFERIFPGSVLVDAGAGRPRESLILLGGLRPIKLHATMLAERLEEPGLRALLRLFGIEKPEDLLARFEGPTASFASILPAASNTDDNAFVEMRIPRLRVGAPFDFAEIEGRLAATAPVLPESEGEIDVAAVASALLNLFKKQPEWAYTPKLERLLHVHGAKLDPVTSQSLLLAGRLRRSDSRATALVQLRALAAASQGRPEPLRALGEDLAIRVRDFRAGGDAFAEAYARAHDPGDAYDAARAYHHVDPSLASTWAQKIIGKDRARFPRLAVYEAERALAARADRAVLRDLLTEVLRYRDTDEGRENPQLSAVAGELAAALGDDRAARRYADLDHEGREARARPILQLAADAIASGHLDEAGTAIVEAEELLPASARVADLRVRLAAKRSDPRALALAFADVRAAAVTVADGISAENTLRLELGLPLLPMFPPREATQESASNAGGRP